ncbi:MAG: hypothetical protein QOE90_2009 [Thermoplasmata archaeon]|jgi:hypothetical protein|nr:hypothetical protein [Thermoplasmata archaeon]
MKATLLVLASLLALTAVSTAAPGASAIGYCTFATGDCTGYFVCVGPQYGDDGQIVGCSGANVPIPPCACQPYD